MSFSNCRPCKSIDEKTKLPCAKADGHDGYHTREIVWSDFRMSLKKTDKDKCKSCGKEKRGMKYNGAGETQFCPDCEVIPF